MDRTPSSPPLRLDRRSAGWPNLLAEIADPPRLLWLTGDPAALEGPCCAVVGTRRATPRGLAVARGLGAALASRGWTVVSGLARGVDAAAHHGALEVGGRTVAVMATGADTTYPRAHRDLRRRLEENGGCVTELAAGAPPLRHHFPRRNRIIAGLSRAVVVVEAPRRSGALITARLALEAGREVFAVPGPVDGETSRGCHHLLREGACLLEDATDVDRVLGVPDPDGGAGGPGLPSPRPGSAAAWILDRVDLEGVSRDALRSRWPGNEAAWGEGLLALELAGLIRWLPGGRLVRTIWR